MVTFIYFKLVFYLRLQKLNTLGAVSEEDNLDTIFPSYPISDFFLVGINMYLELSIHSA